MFTKFAAFEVLSAVMVPEGSSVAQGDTLVRTAHRAVFDYDVRPGYLYVRSRAISSRCNDNFDEFPAEEIKTAYRTFVGKPVFVNHHNDNHRRARGVIIDAVLHEDKNPDGTPDTWAEVLMEVDAVRFPKLAEAVLKGHIARTSMGTDVAHSICSACGNKATTPAEYCAHIPRMKGQRIYKADHKTGSKEGVLIREICYGLGFFENSLLVEEPADPTAFFTGVDTRGLAKAAARDQATCPHTDAPWTAHDQCTSCGAFPMEEDRPCTDPWCVENEPEHDERDHIDPSHRDEGHEDYASAKAGVDEVSKQPHVQEGLSDLDIMPHGPSKYSLLQHFGQADLDPIRDEQTDVSDTIPEHEMDLQQRLAIGKKVAGWSYTQHHEPMIHPAGTVPHRPLMAGDTVLYPSGASEHIRAHTDTLLHTDHGIRFREPIEGDDSKSIVGIDRDTANDMEVGSPEEQDFLKSNPTGPTKYSLRQRLAGRPEDAEREGWGTPESDKDAWGQPKRQAYDGHGAWDCNNYQCVEHPQSMYEQGVGMPGWMKHDLASPEERAARSGVNDALNQPHLQGAEDLLDQQGQGPTKYSLLQHFGGAYGSPPEGLKFHYLEPGEIHATLHRNDSAADMHSIIATAPGDDGPNTQVGHLHWSPSYGDTYQGYRPGEIASVHVDHKYRRRGIADSMMEHGQQLHQTGRADAPPVHSDVKTGDGMRWADAVSGDRDEDYTGVDRHARDHFEQQVMPKYPPMKRDDFVTALLQHFAAAEVTDDDRANHARLMDPEDSGFSHHPVHGKPPEGGYVFSASPTEHNPSTSVHLKDHELTPERVAEHRKLLQDNGHLDKPGWYQGGWREGHTGETDLDLSYVTPDHKDAYEQGLKHRQKAYFDLNTFKDMYYDKHRDPDYMSSKDPDKYKEREKWAQNAPPEYMAYEREHYKDAHTGGLLEHFAGANGDLPAGLTLSHEQDDEGDHHIYAHLPSGDWAGTLSLAGDDYVNHATGEEYDPGTVLNVETHPDYARRGVATAMWGHAISEGLNPTHSTDRSKSGDAWASAVHPGHGVPNLTPHEALAQHFEAGSFSFPYYGGDDPENFLRNLHEDGKRSNEMQEHNDKRIVDTSDEHDLKSHMMESHGWSEGDYDFHRNTHGDHPALGEAGDEDRKMTHEEVGKMHDWEHQAYEDWPGATTLGGSHFHTASRKTAAGESPEYRLEYHRHPGGTHELSAYPTSSDELGGRRAGYLRWGDGEGGHYGEVEMVHVHPDHRGRGLATLMYNHGHQLHQTGQIEHPPVHSPTRTPDGESWVADNAEKFDHPADYADVGGDQRIWDSGDGVYRDRYKHDPDLDHPRDQMYRDHVANPPMRTKDEFVATSSKTASEDMSHFEDQMKGSEGKELGRHLWEGIQQIFDPGSTEESRESDRNIRATNKLLEIYPPHQIRHDADDIGGAPYAKTSHPSGWFVKDYSGPHLNVGHEASGEEDEHDVLSVGHPDVNHPDPSAKYPGFTAGHARQHLDDWVKNYGADYAPHADKRIIPWQKKNGYTA